MKLEFSQQIFEKFSNNKYHGNQPSGSRALSFGWTHEDMTNIIFSFRYFAKKTKNLGVKILGMGMYMLDETELLGSAPTTEAIVTVT
jgi:hypothetical protein